MKDHTLTRRQLFARAVPSALAKAPSVGHFIMRPEVFMPHMDASGYTPTKYFYQGQIRNIPAVDPAYWTLQITGLVKTPLTLTLDDVQAMPTVQGAYTVLSAGSSARNILIGHALWEGVPLMRLLVQAGVLAEAKYAYLIGADGYSTSIALGGLTNALAALRMNGDVLPPEQGYPARVVVPGLYSYKMPKWVRRIELSATPIQGFWEAQGMSLSGTVATMAAILSPRHLETVSGAVAISGIAYAGDRAIRSIEVSIDDAPWMAVPFAASAPNVWTPWQIEWTAPAPGDYPIQVRASDTATLNASSAMHSVVAQVR